MQRHLAAVSLVVAAAFSGCGPSQPGRESEQAFQSKAELTSKSTLTCSSLALTAGAIGSGQSAASLAVRDQSLTQDSWDKYVEFSRGSVASCTYRLPTGAVAADVTGLRLRLNYRGPSKSEMAVTFSAIDATTGALVLVVDNTSAQSWVWSPATLGVPAPLARFFGGGAMKIRIAAASSYDNFQLDELVVLADIEGSTSSTDAGTPPPSSGVKLPPAGKVVWDWQIGAIGDANIVPPGGAKLIDVDGFNTTATKVAQLKAQGLYTVFELDALTFAVWPRPEIRASAVRRATGRCSRGRSGRRRRSVRPGFAERRSPPARAAAAHRPRPALP